MSLQKCYGCVRKISTDANQCPKGGERDPTPAYRKRPMVTKSRFWIFFMIGVVIVTLLMSVGT